MAHITNSLPAGPTSEAEIQKFEAYIGHALPADYRAFLLEHNGGRPDPDAFTFNLFENVEEDVVMCFFPLRSLELGAVEVKRQAELRTWPLHCAWDDLQHDLVHLYEMEPDYPLLPVGTDGSTNYFCLVLAGPRRGAVLFLESEMAETVELAGSFTEFLQTLRPRQRDDYAPELA